MAQELYPAPQYNPSLPSNYTPPSEGQYDPAQPSNYTPPDWEMWSGIGIESPEDEWNDDIQLTAAQDRARAELGWGWLDANNGQTFFDA